MRPGIYNSVVVALGLTAGYMIATAKPASERLQDAINEKLKRQVTKTTDKNRHDIYASRTLDLADEFRAACRERNASVLEGNRVYRETGERLETIIKERKKVIEESNGSVPNMEWLCMTRYPGDTEMYYTQEGFRLEAVQTPEFRFVDGNGKLHPIERLGYYQLTR